ncbi:MAG: hypothetical protein LAP21_27535, partial [Acidobacteriia bacterium]|nr:hypothetical protein [Terriglobia bacterium]
MTNKAVRPANRAAPSSRLRRISAWLFYNGDGNFSSSSTTTSVQVIVGDFSITATPASETISSGHQAVYTITVTPIGGLTGVVNL